MPNVMVLRGGAFGREIGHKDGALMNAISALVRGDMRKVASFCCLQEDRHLQSRRRVLTRTQPCCHHDLGLANP